jgi:folate-dependent phosphoribosylglycinamide formyltransferase PurN
MNIVLLTNDNYFSFTVLRRLLQLRKADIKLVIFSSALIGKRGTLASIHWSLKNTGFSHTVFKLSVYGVFKLMKIICTILAFVPNKYSTFLWIRRNNLPFIVTDDINSPDVVEKIKSVSPDLIISVSMNQIVKNQILEMPPKRCINVHCAPLPRYAGMSPYVWALANNEDHSAATVHYMEQGLDEGDIIVQEKVPVQPNDSAFALFCRCCLKASEILLITVDNIETDKADSYKQDMSNRSYFSWPTVECIKQLHKNGYRLARIRDFLKAIIGINHHRTTSLTKCNS